MLDLNLANAVGGLAEQAKSAAKRSLVTAALAVVAALVIASAAGFAGAAAYMFLALHVPAYMASLLVAIALLAVGWGVLAWVGRSTPIKDAAAQQPAPKPANDGDPEAELISRAAAAAVARTRTSPTSTMMMALAAGVAYGLMSQRKDD